VVVGHVDGRPVPPAGPPPYRIGEHTRVGLAGLLNHSDARIEALEAARVIALP